MIEEERYLGGLSSGDMRMKGQIAFGYGIYATTKRIIGVKSSKGLGIFFGPVGVLVTSDRDEFHSKALTELLAQRDIEVDKENIVEIEMKPVKLAGLTTFGKPGHLSIALGSGGRIAVLIGDQDTFGKVVNLMMAFCPERVRILNG